MRLPRFKVALARAALATFALPLACTQPTQASTKPLGAVRVTAITNGLPIDADGYRVLLGQTPEAPTRTQAIPSNGVIIIEGAAPGASRLFLDGMASNCAAELPYPVDVIIHGSDTTDAMMRVQCGPQRLHRTEAIGSGSR